MEDRKWWGENTIRSGQLYLVLSSPQVTHLVFTMFSFTCSLHISNLINLFGGFSGK